MPILSLRVLAIRDAPGPARGGGWLTVQYILCTVHTYCKPSRPMAHGPHGTPTRREKEDEGDAVPATATAAVECGAVR